MKPLLFLILMVLSLAAQAQFDPVTLPLYDKVPNTKPSDEREQIRTQDIALVGKVQEPSIQVFLPSKRNATRQAVVVCPGGGYSVLAYDWEGTDIAKWLNSHGIAAIVLKYRLPSTESQVDPHEVPLMDAQRALRLTRQHAEEWNIDPAQVGVMGFSAGGHLASTLGTHYDHGRASAQDPTEKFSSRPDFLILGYPVISLKEHVAHIGSRNNLLGKSPTDDLVERFSNDLQVTEDTPPTFIFHSQDDTGVPVQHSLLFYQALVEAKVPVEMHLYPKGGHGYSLGINAEGTYTQWPTACIQWLQQLRKSTAPVN
ncbi:MAG TPA: alpha/beta hydrolase [Cyclobacteriaceae bacterium]|nr:alpha/beta hydrolase [Cyclobacteriaceae bacterium]